MNAIARIVAAALVATPLLAQTSLPDSGLEWRSPAMPIKYFDATGRRAAVFGRQDGSFEAWIWPIKLLHGFHLEFHPEGSVEPVKGESALQQVITRPESTTLVYSHPKFTVRETVWIPMQDPAVVVFFEVDSAKPLGITAKFTPDFQPMWPASFGGVHSGWQDNSFAFYDALEEHAAIVGSPAVAGSTVFIDHQLSGGESVLELRVTPEQARRGPVPLLMTLDMDGEKAARETYGRLLPQLQELYAQKAAYERDFLARTTKIETPDRLLNRAYDWAKVAMDDGWVCTPTAVTKGIGSGPDAGCGMVAGYGPSFGGQRPGFAWWFGGDGLLATWVQEDYGDLTGALQELRFLKARQRPDGKITHEMPQSVDLVDWFGKFHFAYMHADTTPMYLYSVAEYWRRTGDRAFLQEFWDSAKKAYQWCVSTTDPDGLMNNTKAGLGAIEVGALRGKVVKDVYLEGFWTAGLDGMRTMAGDMNDRALVTDVTQRLSKARNSLETQWWVKDSNFVFGLTDQGQQANMIGNWPAVLITLNPQFSPGDGGDQVVTFNHPDMMTDWGTRGLSNKDSLYDPVSYNNGTAWPYMNTFVNWAQYLRGGAAQAYATLRQTANLTGIQSPGSMPEHMNGDFFLPGERSVAHQLFSSVGVLIPVVRGLFGLRVEGIGYGTERDASVVAVHPALPPTWPGAKFSNYVVGSAHLSGEIKQQPGRLEIALESDSPKTMVIDFAPQLPLGAAVKKVTVNGQPWEDYSSPYENGAQFIAGYLDLKGKADVVVEYDGGAALIPPDVLPQPGGRTESLKILYAGMLPTRNGLRLRLAGIGGRTYTLGIATTQPKLTAPEGVAVRKTASGFELSIPFEGNGYVEREIRVTY